MHRRYSYTFRRYMPLRSWALTALSLLVVGLTLLVVNTANAQDNMAYEDWPQQSRADRLGTFTYVYGGAGFVTHSGTTEGEVAYRGISGTTADTVRDEDAEEDGDDILSPVALGCACRMNLILNSVLLCSMAPTINPALMVRPTQNRTNRCLKCQC